MAIAKPEGVVNGNSVTNNGETIEKIPKNEANTALSPPASQENRTEVFQYGWKEIVCVLFSLVTYTADQVTDIIVAIYFFGHGKYWYFGLTLAFVIIPALTMTVFSLMWYVQDYTQEKRPPASRLHWALRVIFLFLHFGPILRYLESLIYGIRSKKSTDEDKKDYFYMMIYEDTDAGLLRLFECFMESAPQLVLQIYILARNDLPENVDQPIKIGLQILSVLTSLTSLAWAMASYNRSLRFSVEGKMKMTWIGTIFQFFWQFFAISSRVLALALFASLFTYWVFVFCAGHWLVMTTWIWFQKTEFCQKRWEEFFFDVVMGIIYIFCFFNVKDERTRFKYIFYYIVLLLEGTALMSCWFLHSDPNSWYLYPALFGFYSSFLAGLIFMFAYYHFFHPSMARPADWIPPDEPDGLKGDYCIRQNSRFCTKKLGRIEPIDLGVMYMT